MTIGATTTASCAASATNSNNKTTPRPVLVPNATFQTTPFGAPAPRAYDRGIGAVQPRIFLLGGSSLHDEQRLPGGHPHAQHAAALRRGGLRGVFPARYCQIQPRRSAGCRGGLHDRHSAQSGLYASLHLPRHYTLTIRQLRRCLARFPRSDRTTTRPARPLLQPWRNAPPESAIRRGYRGLRQIRAPRKQGGRCLHLSRIELPAPEGYAEGLRGFRAWHSHQPRKPERLQPSRCALPAAAALQGGRGGFQQGDCLRLDLPALVLQPRAGLLRHTPSDGRPGRF